MADEKMERCKRVFGSLCTALDNRGWHYEKYDEDLVIKCGVQGDDLPIDLVISVEADIELIMLMSRLPVVISEERRLDAAIAVNYVNAKLVDGSFDFNLEDGVIVFRMTSSFIESEIGSELFDYMIWMAINAVDRYNDKFFMLEKGMMSLKEFIKDISE